jgi:uncharacterized integral membrane protein
MTRKNRATALIVCLVLAAVLMIQNRQVVPLKLLLWDVRMPCIVLILITLMAGFVSGLLFAEGRRKR